jgi:hypothetical protein
MKKVNGLKGGFLAVCLYCGYFELRRVSEQRSETSIKRFLQCQCGAMYEVASDLEAKTWYVKITHCEGPIPALLCPECGEGRGRLLSGKDISHRECSVCLLQYTHKGNRLEGAWQDTTMPPDRRPGDELKVYTAGESIMEEQLPKALDYFPGEPPKKGG